MKVHVLVDKWQYSEGDAHAEFLRSVRDRYPSLITQNSKHMWSIGFTGAIWNRNDMAFILPCRLIEPNQSDIEQVSKYISLTLKTLLQYEHEPSDNRSEDLYLLRSDEQCSEIALSVDLLKDYEKNGILIRSQLIHSRKPAGRLNWVHTVNRSPMFLSSSGPFYPEPIYTANRHIDTDPLCLIHRAVVNHCDKAFGWILNPSHNINIDAINEPPSAWLPFALNECLNILDKELSSSFSDRDNRVIQIMLSLLDKVDKNHGTERIAYGTKYYWEIWERGCKRFFDDDDNLYTNLLPQPKWQIAKGVDAKHTKISQRPDVLAVHGSTLYVLDAKYYEVRKNLPGWEDIGKQYWYEKSLEASAALNFDVYKGLENTTNALLVPGEPSTGIKEIAKAGFPPKIMEIMGLKQLPIFSIDAELLINTYLGKTAGKEACQADFLKFIYESEHSVIHRKKQEE